MSGSIIEIINKFGVMFCDNALKVLFQSSVLIAVLLVIDLLIRKRVKAVFRYCVWLLVFVKLIIPPTLSLPTGIGYWLSDLFPEKTMQSESALYRHRKRTVVGKF
jgi:beta-lactamase regulating signal transducer with metallopeptidase domain